MAMTQPEYLSQLQALLPTGAAWPRDPDATLTQFLAAFADELARLDARGEQLLDETDPHSTFELLADWERVAGLPDPCVTDAQTSGQRRDALVARLTSTGGQSRQYFIDLAAALGFTVSITESRAHTVSDDVDARLYDDAWAFTWRVNAAQTTIWELTVEASVDDPLAAWGNVALECAIRRIKPAHTTVLFAYS